MNSLQKKIIRVIEEIEYLQFRSQAPGASKWSAEERHEIAIKAQGLAETLKALSSERLKEISNEMGKIKDEYPTFEDNSIKAFFGFETKVSTAKRKYEKLTKESQQLQAYLR